MIIESHVTDVGVTTESPTTPSTIIHSKVETQDKSEEPRRYNLNDGGSATSDPRKQSAFTIDEIKRHDKPEDLWMIIYNKVYDVTLFAQDHPGGVEVLYDCGGVDATEAFDDVAHSEDAVKMLQPYFIGEVIKQEWNHYPRSRAPPPPPIMKKTSTLEKRKSQHLINERLALWALGVIALAALAVYIGIQMVKWNF